MNIRKLYSLFTECGSISIDSRNVPPGSLFVGIRGDRFNGNKFAAEALKKGAARAIIDDAEIEESPRMIRVEDSVKFLQDLARFHRQQLSAHIICITGSNGKTTTKELMQRVLGKKYQTFATRGNLNNHIGLPLSLLEVQYSHEMAIIEMGANHPGENRLLAEIALPDFGIITNIGLDHLEGFGSIEGIKTANGELFGHLQKHNKKAFVNNDDPAVTSLATGLNQVSYGLHLPENAPAYAGKVLPGNAFMQLEVVRENGENAKPWRIDSNLFGSFQFPNIMCTVAVGRYFGVTRNDIRDAVASYLPENNRSQIIRTPSHTLLLDAYNANPTSMLLALESFREWKVQPKVVILGDMLEMGKFSEAEHRNIVCWLHNHQHNFQHVVLVGAEFARHIIEGFHYFPNREEAGIWLKENLDKGSYILIKGSRKLELERISL